MRTTLAIDDDVLTAVRELASSEGKTLGEVISELARIALRPTTVGRKSRNGVPLLPVRASAMRVTSEMVRQFQEELR